MPNCPICLDQLKTKSLIGGCNHEFCFKCIVTWTNISNFCPLCKQEFHEIKYFVYAEKYRIHKIGPHKKREWGVYEIEYLSKRIKFYQQNRVSEDLKPSTSSKVHSFEPEYFIKNPEKLNLLINLVEIDLSAILYYTEQSIPMMVQFVKALLLKGIDCVDLHELQDYLGEHAFLFIHEIKQYGRSSLSLDSYIRICDSRS